MLWMGSLKSLLPHAQRRIICCNRVHISNISGMAKGYKQTNVLILHKSLADDFEKFCHANSGPLPLLYRSKPGEWKCPSLSSDPDIRTDCLQYRKYEYGASTGPLKSLKDYSEQLKDMVAFYLGSPLAFTHYSGCTFMTDLKNDSATLRSSREVPQVHCISKDPLHYSMVSAEAAKKIKTLESLIGTDPGDRGIGSLLCPGELLKACLSLSHSRSVLITTGFPTHFNYEPPEENDGPPGALAIAAMLQALEKDVAIVTDQRAMDLNKKIIEEAVQIGILKEPVPLLSYQRESANSALKFLCENGNPGRPRFDHLIAIERAGMAADGNYYNARKVNVKHLVDPIDELFLAAQTIPGITTTGVGDGGNELGMGKVKDAVKKHIKNGDVIACDVEADFAVVAGVSNWGGYAIACALYILSTCEIHDRYLRRAVGFSQSPKKTVWLSALPSVTKEEKLLKALVQLGVRSGKSASLEMEVDALPFYSTHSLMIENLLQEVQH
ncbi:hypothetical protein ASZ78_014722 [Callipepla squamata]|uniref:D-glutamate cyclase-like C-terminal domain-containing protein n=1 Tax=Callipepla squamata TaxID=9009 RepID=A0A226NL22_CALSU|nr:hypothetical protein ASZ78_014722 [Callipepla squamata]